VRTPQEPTTAAPLLAMETITKSFPGVRALQGVSMEVRSGEVFALMGENGAGKSTLIKVLSGAHLPDSGRIVIDSKQVAIGGPVDAQRAGVSVIYQEFNLIPGLTARENIFLGREATVGGFVRRRHERNRALELIQRIGVDVAENVPCRALTIAQQQVVEIAKALSLDARIIVMDEPTATLSTHEIDRLLQIIRELKNQGLGIIYISHRIEEIFQIADRVMVMRDGAHVETRPVKEVTRHQLIEWMVGRTLEDEFPARTPAIGEERLQVRNLTSGDKVRNVSFSVRRGEILGLTGLVGAGRTETLRAIFGADRADAGDVALDGRRLRIRRPRDAIRAGICLLTEDRKAEGLVLVQSVRENFGLPSLPLLSRFGFVRRRVERDHFAHYIESLRIKIPHQEQMAKNLSGGNQQKVVLAKWLERDCDVILFDEPTRGIDVGAKYEIYLLMNELAARGKAIVMVSSELPAILGMSDRIIVLREGKIAGEITDVAKASQQDVMHLAVQ
jgi:ribose transport system ATP-binding protein